MNQLDTERLIQTLTIYAEGRRRDVLNGLESAELSALLVEKYAIGIVDTLRTLQLDIDVDLITKEADLLCHLIDPDTKNNRQLRYERVAKLDLTEQRKQLR